MYKLDAKVLFFYNINKSKQVFFNIITVKMT